MTKILSKQSEIQRARNRWVMSLSNNLYENNFIDRKEAKRLADMAWTLVEALGRGVVTFRYLKRDGTLRIARGTLMRGIDREFDAYVLKGSKHREGNENTDGRYTYWDLMLREFRSFRAVNLLGIDDIVIK